MNGMPIEATPANNAQVIISQSEDQHRRGKVTSWEKWLPPAIFVGLSGFVLAAELLDLIQVQTIVKILAPLVAGATGFVAASHSSLRRQGQ
jgi:hypothetical protein